jgi:Uma2 family endonuclease
VDPDVGILDDFGARAGPPSPWASPDVWNFAVLFGIFLNHADELGDDMVAEPVFWTAFETDNDAMTDHHEPAPVRLRKPGGFTADDLFGLPDLPPHTELVNGELVIVSPQGNYHSVVGKVIDRGLERARPDTVRVRMDVGVRLPDDRWRCPDVALIRTEAATDLSKNRFDPDDVFLAVEIESPDSHDIDREEKPFEYAAVGIQHFWRIQQDGYEPVVYVYELDPVTQAYELTGVHQGRLKVSVPFDMDVDLTEIKRI